MQTPGEKHLVNQICAFLDVGTDDENVYRPILNIGSGRSISIEKQISDRNKYYVCDHIDIDDCYVTLSTIRHCWKCTVEEMKPVGSNEYDLAFANYVLEHVSNLRKTAREIHRVLRPSGVFVTTLSNPSAPEFILARYTPLWFHKTIRQADTWETIHSYRSISELTKVFEAEGFITQEVRYWPFTIGYLWRYPILRTLSKWYDGIVFMLNIECLMSNVCVTFKKSA